MSRFHTLLLASLSLAMALILSCSNDNDELKTKINEQLRYFERGAALIDSRDGRVYNTVEVYPYTWMADNLDYREGGFNSGGYRCYNDSLIYCDKYGALYNWEMAKSVCPAGWHLPSAGEWREIAEHLGDEAEVITAVLKAKNGFSALLDGGSGGCMSIRYTAYQCLGIYPCHCFWDTQGWWSITDDGNDTTAYSFRARGTDYIDERGWFKVAVGTIEMMHKSFFEHIRCVKDHN
jgi:uncharacterized protein (TIGR02145 family)